MEPTFTLWVVDRALASAYVQAKLTMHAPRLRRVSTGGRMAVYQMAYGPNVVTLAELQPFVRARMQVTHAQFRRRREYVARQSEGLLVYEGDLAPNAWVRLEDGCLTAAHCPRHDEFSGFVVTARFRSASEYGECN